jgi:hypothetical protein
MRTRYANERKLRIQMARRGWTERQIAEALQTQGISMPRPDMFTQAPVARLSSMMRPGKSFTSVATASSMMNSKDETIYVALLDEGVDVWRPVAARRISADTYLIVDQDYDRDAETWEFEPGSAVRCRKQQRDGRQILVAKEMAPTAPIA